MPCVCRGFVPADFNNEHLAIRTNSQAIHKTRGFLKTIEIEGLDLKEQFYYNGCACNESDALERRHVLGNIEGYDPRNGEMHKLRSELSSMARQYLQNHGRFDQLPFKTVIENTRNTLRPRYRRAFLNMRDKRLDYDSRYTRVTAFVKYEKMDIDKFFEGKPSRMIQFRTFEYTYLLKSFVLNHSLAIKNNLIKWNDQEVRTIFSKIHDNFGIAQILKENWDNFLEPVAICLDHSKFDGHYNQDLLKLEHSYWLSLSRSHLFKRLLSDQLSNRGYSQSGLRFKSKGSRCSGEYTTSEGNTLVNYAMLATWVKNFGITNFRITVNGDDSVVFVERDDYLRMGDLNLAYFRNFNMETEVDIVADDFRKISFCQCSPIRLGNELKWFMVREPIRAISRSCYMDYKHLYCVDRILTSLGICDLAVNSGVPLLQSYAINMIDMGSGKPLGSVDVMPFKSTGRLVSQITSINYTTRYDFEIAFGISVRDQLRMEADLGKLRFPESTNATILKYKNFLINHG